ncbi:hypothetical protein [Streptomyces sp. NPDC090798]|uniref:hypothetical protein n=1 Tax=Streptomyces sp. NPDC090798 TaxID=3365968 RepID=UPI00381801FB
MPRRRHRSPRPGPGEPDQEVDDELAGVVEVLAVVRAVPAAAGQRAARADLGRGDGFAQEDFGAGVAAVLVRVVQVTSPDVQTSRTTS